eukprot:NODE_385_length_8329_cov_0.434386.p5 type:complete len:161 gc:universal NODE_385_length_8329_cov_0.434386:2674-2192(-)
MEMLELCSSDIMVYKYLNPSGWVIMRNCNIDDPDSLGSFIMNIWHTDNREDENVPLATYQREARDYLPELTLNPRFENSRLIITARIAGNSRAFFDQWKRRNFRATTNIDAATGFTQNLQFEELPIDQFGRLFLGAVASHGVTANHIGKEIGTRWKAENE